MDATFKNKPMNEPTANNEVKGSESNFTHVILLLHSELIEQNRRLSNNEYFTARNPAEKATIDKTISNITSRIAEIERAIEVLKQTAHLQSELSALHAERQVLNSEIEELREEVEKEVYRRQLAEQLIQWYTEGIYGDVAKMNYECVYNEWKSLKTK